MPCCDIFKAQDEQYRNTVLPPNMQKRVAVETGVSDYWYQFVNNEGRVIGIDKFGASAPAEYLFAAYGYTVENVKQVMLSLMNKIKV